MNERPALLLEEVYKSFGENEVLKGIDLTVAPHEVVCLIGASGSGKSTLLRCVNLVEPIDSGRVVVEGEEITAQGVDANRIRDKQDEYPDRLSGGQQQRVAIVRALAMHPHLMLLDEVTSALDPELVAEVLAVIRELAREGMTMLIATHEMGFARDIADRVCFLEAGRILEQGKPERIFTAPEHPRTRQFLGRIIEAGRL
jgi:polar amino acid transport system ATP-binding protein